MLGEVGIQFGFKGGREAIHMMNRLKSEYGALSSSVDRGADRISSGFSRMASGIKLGAIAATAAIGALTAAAVAIPYTLAQSRAGLTNQQANLRALGLDDTAIETFESAAEAFASKVAGVTKEAYTKASYDVVSAFAGLQTEEQTKIADMALITGKATKMSAESATKLFGSLWGAAGDKIKAEGAEPFVKQWSGAIYTAVKELKTTGEELAAAAKNSISMLMEAGWKPEEMTAFWGQLITSGLSGEAAGTALKQMALKERGAFGKLIAKASGQMIDTEFMRGDAKAAAEAWNKGLIEGAGGEGGKLFKSDPVEWLNRMGVAFDKIKASGEDYKKFIAEIFGEESANAMMQFFEKRGTLKKTIETIAKGSYGDVAKMVEEQMSKGIGPATQIMGQLWDNLKQTMGKSFEGMLAPSFGWLSGKLLQANALWKALFSDTNPIDKIQELDRVGGESLILLYDKLRGLPANIGAFAESFKQGFMSAFDGLGGINAEVSKLVDLLGAPDSTKWKQIGDEWGRLIATDVSGFLQALGTIKEFLSNLWSVLGPVVRVLNGVFNKAAEGYKGAYEIGKDEYKEWLPGQVKFFDEFLTAPTGSIVDEALQKSAPELYAGPQHEEPYPGWQGPRAPATRRIRPGAGASADPGAAPAPTPANIQVEPPKVEVSVKIGERELRDIITETFQQEMSRFRQGAGDGFQMGMF